MEDYPAHQGKKLIATSCLLLITGMALAWFIAQNNGRQLLQAQADGLGETLARQSALLVTELVLANDMISMNVLLNELTRNPAIAQVTVYNVDDQVLAISGRSVSMSNPQQVGEGVIGNYIAPIALQDSLAGYVRVHLADTGLQPGQGIHFWLQPAAMALMLMLSVALLLPQLRRSEQGDTDVQPGASTGLYLRLTNRDAVLEQADGLQRLESCRQLLHDIADLYSAEPEWYDDGDMRLAFLRGADEEESAFQALCAATLFLALNNRHNRQYASNCRLQLQAGLHCASPGNTTTFISGHDEALRVAALICASSPVNGLLASDSVIEQAGIESHFHHEAYGQVFDEDDGELYQVYLVRSPAGSTRTLLQRQAAMLEPSQELSRSSS